MLLVEDNLDAGSPVKNVLEREQGHVTLVESAEVGLDVIRGVLISMSNHRPADETEERTGPHT
jgi:hypothetical protein